MDQTPSDDYACTNAIISLIAIESNAPFAAPLDVLTDAVSQFPIMLIGSHAQGLPQVPPVFQLQVLGAS